MKTKPWNYGTRLALVVFIAAAATAVHGYDTLSYQWSAAAAKSGIVMNLQLGPLPSSDPLSDGSTSWGQVAERALASWNSKLKNFHFNVVRDSTIAKKTGDSKNSVFFSDTLFGKTFGDALAITTSWSMGSTRTEADVVFNTHYTWDSYRGPLPWGGGAQEFYRVALHEFGHALGLDHPDQAGQTVDAVMNSLINNQDELSADDIAGGQHLWGAPLTPGSDVNLLATQPTGWPGKLIVSTVPGANTDSAKFLSNDTLYLDYAVLNKGASPTVGTWTNTVLVDGVPATGDTHTTSLGVNAYYVVEDQAIGPLSAGSHTIKVVMDDGALITETNETDNTFERTITVVPPSSIATLSKLALSSGALSSAFASGVTDYTAAIGNNVFSITVKPTVTQAGAFVKVNDVLVASGTASAGISLSIGSNVITVEVAAEDGLTKKTYTITATRAPDITPPTVVIKTPAANANFNEGAAVTLSGTAADNNGVQKVQMKLNGGAYADVATTVAPGGLSASYTTLLSPKPGLNTVWVKSIDTSTNASAETSRSFTYIVVRPLAVHVIGSGSLPVPFPGTDPARKVGFNYTLTAVPAAGQVFDGWTANSTLGTGITDATAELPKLTFTHQEGLDLTAHFKDNPFTLPVIGAFNGLVTATGGGLTKIDTTGFLSASVTKTGSFTGALKMDGLALAFTGVFDNAGVARFGSTRATSLALKRTGKPSFDLALTLDMTGVTHKILGTVSAAGLVSHVDADRAFYSATNRVVETLAGATSRPYTLVFFHRTVQSGGLTIAEFPQGDGYATGIVKADGTVTFTGKLADDAAITANAPLSSTNAWPLFAQLYSTKKGCIAGMVGLNETPLDTDMRGDALRWIRPVSSSQWYPNGWETGIDVDAKGSKYTPPPASIFPGLPAMDADHGNATLSFTGGLLLTDPLSKDINISPANAATKAPKTDSSFTFTLAAASGLFTGSVNTGPTTKSNFQGVIFQKGTKPIGYGYFLSATPKVIDGTGESGSILLLGR